MLRTLFVCCSALVVLVAFGGGLDDDGDGVPNDVDCRPDDGTLWAPPSEPIDDLMLSWDGALATLDWSPPANSGGLPGTERYDTFGTLDADAFGYPTGYCVELESIGPPATDDRSIQPGEVGYFLVRVENDCGAGPIDSVPAPVQPRSLHYLVATNTNDSGAGSLREAIDLAIDGDAICIDATGTIPLGDPLTIAGNVAVTGPGEELLTIDHSIGLDVHDNGRLSHVTVTGFRGVFLWGSRPSIVSVTAEDCTYGVWIIPTDTSVATISDSTIRNNEIGVYTQSGFFREVAITRTTIAGNDVGYESEYGWTTNFTASTISGNGVGIDLDYSSRATIDRTTISGNTTGIWSYGNYPDDVTITSSTISGNVVGIESDFSYATIRNSILDNGTNCVVYYDGPVLEVISGGHNLISDSTCVGFTHPTDQLGADLQLGPLADNGGPTWTHLPLPGSPVIDAGSCPGESRDQVGALRPVDDPLVPDADDSCDIGSTERQ